MEQTLEHRIRQRAYEIWHAHGRTDGKAAEHWLAAEREVLSSLKVHAAPARDSETASTPRRRNRAKAANAPKMAHANA
jgi:hypothetical protein